MDKGRSIFFSFLAFFVEPPDKPPGVDATNKGSRLLSITWTVPYSGNSPITKYIIEHKASKGKYDFQISSMFCLDYCHFTNIQVGH